MAEERITTIEPQGAGPQTTHTTVIRETPENRSSGSAWLIGIALLLAVATGAFIFTQASQSEIAKDTAIADAANEVGEAAGAVGDTVNNVGAAAEDAIGQMSE